MAPDCIFCKIVAGELPANRIYENDGALVFADLNPRAPVHLLVVPKTHLRDITELAGDPAAAQAMLEAIRDVAAQERFEGFRAVFNTGAAAGQEVFHVHAHLLAGRPLSWPPG